MKTRKSLAWILILSMLMTFVPNFALTVAAATEPTMTQSDTKENTNQAGGIVYTKTSTAKSDGTVDITLSAHTTGEVRQTTSVSPTDIVLVLDVSGSMGDDYTATRITGYNAVTGRRYTYYEYVGFLDWDAFTGYGFNGPTTYYINTGTAQEPVYTLVTYTGRDANGFEMYEYSSGNTEVVVYPVLSDVSATRVYSYDVVQFYSAIVERQEINKMESLQTAVNSFIDTTAQMNTGLDVNEMHTISIVKFAGPHYSNGTTDTPVITEGNGTYTYSNGNNSDTCNYSQVVKGLTPVDRTGASVLKEAVNSLSPAGSTAVDKGLALAEAVLMNRSQVVAEGAVDRNEAVIVFTDGEPNHWSGFDNNVANSAIATAGNLESTADVTVYGVCIDADADATDLDADINKFMHYMTSNFPNATSINNAGEGGSTENGYYMTPDESHSLSMLFQSIIQDIDHPTITLGEEATMIDTISPYFDFENGSATNVTLQTSAKKADGTWADPVADSNLSYNIVEDRLTVDGFDFDANYVSETGRGDNNDFYGKKLVVTFTIVPDYGVIDVASATLMDGILPTNSGFASLVDSDSTSAAQVETPTLSAHSLTYKVDGVEYKDYNRFTGSTVIVDTYPTKEGHTFSGWSYPANITVSDGEFVMPDEDVEITGTFTPNTYNITYQYSGTPPVGAPLLPAATTALYGSAVTVAAPLEFAGYIFKGWYPLQTDVSVTDGTFTMPAKDVTLVGYFESSSSTPYKVEHYLETLTDNVYETTPVLVQDTFTGTTGNTVTATPLNRFEGFEYNETKSATTISGVVAGDGSLVLKVYYDRKEYTVTYGYDGDTQIDGLPSLPGGGTYKYGQTVNVAAKAVPPAGYSFVGWYRGTVDNPAEGSFTMPAYNVNLLGYFIANSGTEYTVEHYLMGTDGTYPATPEDTETFTGTTGRTVTAVPLVKYTGFTYDEAWSAPTNSGEIAGDGSLVLKVYYSRNKYKVTYIYERVAPDGAPDVPAEAEYYHGATVTIEEDPAVAGYTFTSWHHHDTEGAITVNNKQFEMPVRDVNLYGYFTANTNTAYTVEHYLANADNTGYEASPYRTQNLNGTTGETITATPVAIEGFTYDDAASAATKTGTVAGDGSLVLKLYYSRNTYNVTYKYEGDLSDIDTPALPTGGTYAYGTNVTVADRVIAPAGYTFVGWYIGTNDNIVTSFDMPARNVEILGYFAPNNGTKYTVEHYLMDKNGTYPATPEDTETFTGTTGRTVTAVPLVKYTGFTYDEAWSAPTISGEIEGDGSLVLKVYYSRNKYKVTYIYERTAPDGAPDVPAEAEYYHGATVTIEEDPAVAGYTFTSWHHLDTEGAITVNNKQFEMPVRDVNLYGYFTANTNTAYTVEHYIANEDNTGYEENPHATQNFTATTGETITATPVAIEGFTYDDAASLATKTGMVAGDGSLVLKLYYSRNTYNVTYKYEGDLSDIDTPALPTGGTYAYGTNVDVANRVIAPAGYTFVGWYIGTNDNIVTSFDMPARNVEILGHFTPGENTPYTIHHYLETLDGVYDSTPALIESNFTGTTGHTVTATPLNRFTGFTYNPTASAATISGEIEGDGSLVLKVYYDREEYNVTYGYEGDLTNIDEPGLPSGGTYKYGAPVTVAEKATAPAGYTFVGWYRGTQDNPVSTTFDMPAYNVHLLGNFVANNSTPYRVEHYLQTADGLGYELDGTGETRHGTTGAEVSALNKEYPGFTYNATISTASGTIAGDGSFALKFYYDRNTNNVTYVYEGITPANAPAVPSAINGVRYGAEVTVADIPAVPGYTFNGWTTENATISDGKFDMPDKDVVLKGSFASNIVDYKVNYWFQKLDAGNDFDESNYDFDEEHSYTEQAFVGQHVEATEHVHAGYSVNSNSNHYGHVTVNEEGVGNLVLNIYFDRHTYNVTYGYYGEQPAGAPDLSGKNKTNVRYGAVVDVEGKPQLGEHSFDGWYTRTATVADGKFTMPDHDVAFLGRFVTRFTVGYDLNGGTGAEGVDYNTKYVDAETEITVNAAPVRSGYSFTGWKEGTNTFNVGDTVEVDRNIIFVAQWSPVGGGGSGGLRNYTLTYETNGGNEIDSEKYSHGKRVELTKIPVKDGHIFDGWHLDEALTEDVSEVKMTKNITVYAAWVKDNGNAGNGHDTPDGLNSKDHFAYVVGYPDGTVRPNDNISRAEVTSIFFRLLTDEVRDGNLADDNVFNDIIGTEWYNTAVSTMARLGIVEGRALDTFVPNAFITRAEFAAICARFDDSEFEVVDNFTDVKGHWAEDEVHEAAAHGWIRGYEDNTFKPDQFITRAEAMTMINRVLNRVPETTLDLLSGMIKWPDNSDESVWYYIPVQEATNSHDYDMKNHIYEKWTALRDVTDWTQYE